LLLLLAARIASNISQANIKCHQKSICELLLACLPACWLWRSHVCDMTSLRHCWCWLCLPAEAENSQMTMIDCVKLQQLTVLSFHNSGSQVSLPKPKTYIEGKLRSCRLTGNKRKEKKEKKQAKRPFRMCDK